MKNPLPNALPLCALLASTGASAKFSLGSPFTDHMVIQHDKPLVVWGWDTAGTGIKVSLADEVANTTANPTGRWQVEITAPKPGGPYELIAKGSTAIRCKAVLSGEVWLASGQSNMVMPLRDSDSLQEALETADNPNIRFFQVKRTSAEKPRDIVEGSWVASTKKTAPLFSGVAYHFAARLQKELDMPVGIIEAAWGGSCIYAWTPQRVMEKDARYAKLREVYGERSSTYRAAMEAWMKGGQQGARPPSRGGEIQQGISNLDNAMLHPLKPYPVKGVIWYQGEADAIRAVEYKKRFSDLVASWREDWGDSGLPVYFVQLPAFGNPVGEKFWPAFRNAQRESAREIPNAEMAVTIDSGEPDEIHPKDKRTPGLRLAQLALAKSYGKDIVPGGPLPEQAAGGNGKVTVRFSQIGQGLELRGDGGHHMVLVDANGEKRNASFEISRNAATLRIPSGFTPVAVRYAWEGFPTLSLYNRDGFPASPFEISITQ